MSNRRTIFYLLFLLTLAIGGNLYLDISRNDNGEVVRRKTLVGDADGAVSLELFSDGVKTVRLEKSDGWRVVEPFRASADEDSVLRLTDALAFKTIIDRHENSAMARMGRTLEDFGLGEVPRLRLVVKTPGGETEVSFGETLVSGEGVYASVKGYPFAYVVANEVFAAANLDAGDWRRRSAVDVSADEVTSMDIRRGDTPTVRLVRSGNCWEVVEPRKSPASAAAVKGILDAVLSCKAQEFFWPVGATNETETATLSMLSRYGLDPETSDTVTFHTAAGRDHSISFGSGSTSNAVYALIQDGSAVATVAAGVKKALSLDGGTLVDGRIFPIDKATVQRISMVDGETAYLLARGDNGLWRMDAPVSASADEEAVDGLVAKLLVMRSSDLDENGVKVSLSTNSQPVAVSRSALLESGGFDVLRSKTVVDIDAKTVKRLVISNSGDDLPQSVVFDPERNGWSVESTGRAGVIDQGRLEAVLAALHPLKARSVARLKASPAELAKYGLEKPSCTIAVDRLLEDSVRRNIFIGKSLNLDGDVYATVGTSDAVFILDGETVKTLTVGVYAE